MQRDRNKYSVYYWTVTSHQVALSYWEITILRKIFHIPTSFVIKIYLETQHFWIPRSNCTVCLRCRLQTTLFALPAEVFSSCLAIVSAVMVGGHFLWPALRYGTGYQTVWEIRPLAETPSSVHWRHFYFQLTRVHSALELSGRCALQIYLLT